MRTQVAGIVLLALIGSPLLSAHHTVAYTFDVSKSVALMGTVTSVEWKNPHVIYHLAVADDSGRKADWEVESRHLDGMRRAGIGMDTIKVGDTVTMNVFLALDGSHRAATVSIVLPDGTFVCAGTATARPCS